MTWFESLVLNVSPGLFSGVRCGDWLRLLCQNRFAITPLRWPKAAAISAASAGNSICWWYERLRYIPQVRDIAIEPPVFVLGHWRSGTTHLHNLLAIDERFAYPNLYQVLFPHTFLSSEPSLRHVFGPLVPRTRVFDNVRLGIDVPTEEEFALCNSTFLSPYMSTIFPKREAHYDRYLTFRGVPEQEVQRWREAFLLFLKKLTWKYRRPIILKSPPHTCRIRLLLDLFPGARFVHIHREPYTVFQSTKHMFLGWDHSYHLQRRDFAGLDERVIRQYKEMHEVFFEEKGLIPAGRFHEVAFEDLEKDPLGEMRRLYAAIDLPAFSEVEPALIKYQESLSDYKKNKHYELEPALKQRIAVEWRRCFDEWGYPT